MSFKILFLRIFLLQVILWFLTASLLFFVRFCAVTEGSSEYSDSDLDMSRRRSRRSQKKQVNYCETSESEGSQAETNQAKTKPRRQQESSDSDGQSETLEWLINLFRLVINQMS